LVNEHLLENGHELLATSALPEAEGKQYEKPNSQDANWDGYQSDKATRLVKMGDRGVLFERLGYLFLGESVHFNYPFHFF